MSSGAQARPTPRQPPRLPERYRLRRHIASGGMAAVWCAEDLVLDRTVAIKILAERFAHDQLAVRRFKREARAAARVSGHAHVVTVFDVGDTEPPPADLNGESRAFIVMEYLAGGTVADAIRVGAVRRHEAMRWLGEAAAALDHAHGCGIVHRDIKPANFLLDRNRVLHVADFGIARLISEDTITTSDQLFGTAAYLSPEQALGRPGTSASDRYALAVAAFELLVGERPFTATHFTAQARQHVEDEPPCPSDRNRTLPAAVDAVLLRGMAKEPDARFESAGEFVEALQRALSEVEAAPTGPALAAVADRRRRPNARRVAAGARAIAGARTAGGPRLPAGARSATRGRPAAATKSRRATTAATPNPSPIAWTPAAAIDRASGRRRGGRIAALAGLLVVIAGIVAFALSSGGGTPARRTAASSRHSTRTTAAHRPSHHAARPRPAPTVVASASASTTSTAAASASPPSAAELQATGHQEMVSGDYQSAISTLRQAVQNSDPGSLTYAYALYDLGRSLVLGGDPASAIPVLQQRLKIPNQTDVVRQMLDQALKATGRAPQSPPTQTTPTQPAKPRGGPSGPKTKPGEPTGGAGLAGPSIGHGRGHAYGHLRDHTADQPVTALVD